MELSNSQFVVCGVVGFDVAVFNMRGKRPGTDGRGGSLWREDAVCAVAGRYFIVSLLRAESRVKRRKLTHVWLFL